MIPYPQFPTPDWMFIPSPLKSAVTVRYIQRYVCDSFSLAISLSGSRYWIKSNVRKQASKVAGKKQSFCLLNLLLSVSWYSRPDSHVSWRDKTRCWRMAGWQGGRGERAFLAVRVSALLVKKRGETVGTPFVCSHRSWLELQTEGQREKTSPFCILVLPSIRLSYHILYCLLRQGRMDWFFSFN